MDPSRKNDRGTRAPGSPSQASSDPEVQPSSREEFDPESTAFPAEDESEPLSDLDEDTPEDASAPQHSVEGGVHGSMATAGTYNQAWTGAARETEARQTAYVPATPDDGSDAGIMLRVRNGDDSGFTYLIEKYRKQMIHYMFRMTGNLAVAEELAQEAFLRVYRSREGYRAEAKFTTWLYRIATNLGVNYARDHRHEKAAQSVYLDQPDAESGTTPDVADSRLTVEQALMRNERLAGIRAQVMALPERQRQAVLMHKYQEMDYREISAVLKLSESATKSLLFRAYQTLRERLKDYV